eukprot:TRINITY_DN5559_c0_g1_i1.p1 TRINITY_DN5559_c0_g1~~TRINITY_DN5559_c0_g1_i1.p1  ORF type:complete len:585 (+),score=134.66 TRINITY_DN5559_c0_g1_i1:31-1785(+)
MVCYIFLFFFFFFFKQKTAYEIMPSLVGSEMCIRDSINAEYMGSANDLGKKVVNSFKPDNLIKKLAMTENGFMQISLTDQFIEEQINIFLKYGIVMPPNQKKQKIAVDFSSPNVAKNLHVGHLRSTIIGESICRILEFEGHDVLRINHVGDWGTQFGMLIAYMSEQYPNYLEETPVLSDLNDFYKAAKKKFDESEDFKKKSQETVVKLQSGDAKCIQAWKVICEISRQSYNRIYKRLWINITEVPESFYNPMLPGIIEEMEKKGIITVDKGAKCVFLGKPFQIPLMVQKKDGGFNYDSTDMAAIKHRIITLGCTRLIYITDMGQEPHFKMIFKAAEMMGWLNPKVHKVEHMGFGVVQGEDKKRFKTRSGVTIKLESLLDEAQTRAMTKIQERAQEQLQQQNPDEEVKANQTQTTGTKLDSKEYQTAAEKMGIAAIKYYDLKFNRTSDYQFSFDNMLDDKGNTGIYLLYAYARLCSIIRKSGYTEESLKELTQKQGFKITHPHERYISCNIIRFFDTIAQVSDMLEIHRLTDYLYDIASKIGEGYNKYKILSNNDTKTRILLIYVLKMIMSKCFSLLAIEPLDKI